MAAPRMMMPTFVHLGCDRTAKPNVLNVVLCETYT